MRIKKAVIPAAGLGTRFLPATKSMPKEMLPIVDTPTIQYIVEEALNSGIEEILIITNSNKHSLENHFDINYELEKRLLESDKPELAIQIRKIGEMVNIHYVRQKEPRGLGHAILCARAFIGNEPFAVLLGDDIIVNKNKPVLKQMIEEFENNQSSILGVQTVPEDDVVKYGIVNPLNEVNKRTYQIKDIVEKPFVADAPSRLAVLGRYILTPQIFDLLETQKPGKGGEIQLTDSIKRLIETQKVYAYDFVGTRYDVGDKFGFVKATIDFALDREDIGMELLEYLKNLKKEKE